MSAGDISPSSNNSPSHIDGMDPVRQVRHPQGTMYPHRIFVGGINANTSEHELKVYFSQHGRVRDVKIIIDKDGTNKGYAFITFDNEVDAQKIIDMDTKGNHLYFRDRKLNIGPAIRKAQSHSQSDANDIVDTGVNNIFYLNGIPYTQNASGLLQPLPVVPTATVPTAGDQTGQIDAKKRGFTIRVRRCELILYKLQATQSFVPCIVQQQPAVYAVQQPGGYQIQAQHGQAIPYAVAPYPYYLPQQAGKMAALQCATPYMTPYPAANQMEPGAIMCIAPGAGATTGTEVIDNSSVDNLAAAVGGDAQTARRQLTFALSN